MKTLFFLEGQGDMKNPRICIFPLFLISPDKFPKMENLYPYYIKEPGYYSGHVAGAWV